MSEEKPEVTPMECVLATEIDSLKSDLDKSINNLNGDLERFESTLWQTIKDLQGRISDIEDRLDGARLSI